MNSLKFLDKVLPTAGLRVIASKGKTGGMHHVWVETNEEVAHLLSGVDANKRVEYYIGCASCEVSGSRKAENASMVRSLWLDLDVGDDPRKYPDQATALKALIDFCNELSINVPTVVDSGGGLHAWLTLLEDHAAAEGRPVMEKLKAAAKILGLLADPTRTADIASILRIPGTLNHKTTPGKLVKVLYWGKDGALSNLNEALDSYLGAQGIGLSTEFFLPPGGPARALPVTNDLAAGIPRGSWFDDLTPVRKDECLVYLLTSPSVIAAADAPYPEWFPVVAACARSGAPNAMEICRRWSRLSSKYEAASFDKTFNSFAARHVVH